MLREMPPERSQWWPRPGEQSGGKWGIDEGDWSSSGKEPDDRLKRQHGEGINPLLPHKKKVLKGSSNRTLVPVIVLAAMRNAYPGRHVFRGGSQRGQR